MATWHYIKHGAIRDQQIGPIDTDTLAKRIERGEIKPETLIASQEKTQGHFVPMRRFEKLAMIYERGRDAREEAKRQERAVKAQQRAQAREQARKQRAIAKRERTQARLTAQQERRLAEMAERPARPPVPAQAAPPPGPVYQQAPQPGASIVNVHVGAQQRQSNAGAVLLSFLLLGLGQISQGRIAAAAFWWALSVANVLLCFTIVWIPIALFVGPLIWLANVIDAGMYRG